MHMIVVALIIPLIVYLVAASLPRGRGGFVVIGVMLLAGGIAWLQAGSGPMEMGAHAVSPARITLMMAGIGLALGAFAQFLRLYLPAGASPMAYPGVVAAVAFAAVGIGAYLLGGRG